MDVKTLCLGVLTFGDASGYDIKKYFERTFSHFFAAGYGSIYPALAELADAGLVTCQKVTQEGRPDRKVYSLTESGRQTFLHELATTAPLHKVRSEFLALMFFAHLLPPERLNAVLEERLADINNSIAMIEQCPAQQSKDIPHDAAGMHFCSNYGKAMLLRARDCIGAHQAAIQKTLKTTVKISPQKN